MTMTTTEMCAVCHERRTSVPAVTKTEAGQPVCFTHAPADYRDAQTITRALAGFVVWHEEQATRLLDVADNEARKPLSIEKNRALAQAHRTAADAIRDVLNARSA